MNKYQYYCTVQYNSNKYIKLKIFFFLTKSISLTKINFIDKQKRLMIFLLIIVILSTSNIRLQA